MRGRQFTVPVAVPDLFFFFAVMVTDPAAIAVTAPVFTSILRSPASVATNSRLPPGVMSMPLG